MVKRRKSNVLSIMIFSLFLCVLIPAPVFGDLIDDVSDLDTEEDQEKQKDNYSEGDVKSEQTDSSIDKDMKETNSKAKENEKEVSIESNTDSQTSKKKKSPKRVKGDSQASKQPIHFKSSGKTVYTKDGGTVILEKDVVITQGNLNFRADKAKVYLNEENEDEDVEKVEIFGNVRVSRYSKDPSERVKALGNKAFFFNSKQKVDLIGNARLYRGGHLIKGRKITYFLETGMITVDRAEGVVQPIENGGKKR